MTQNSITISNFEVSNKHPFFLIAGPCSIEGKNHAIDHAGKIKEICDSLNINFVYKSSFDKANRSSSSSIRGVGLEKGLDVLLAFLLFLIIILCLTKNGIKIEIIPFVKITCPNF